MIIPFNKPYMTGNEFEHIRTAYDNAHLSGDGPFTLKCHQWLQSQANSSKALLTHSCTAALEIAALLLDVQPGDEIIMPSYTFVSTANAFALRGGVPVFVDIREDTLNIDETLIEAAITNKTKAIVPVHYAGVACEMDAILSIAKKYDLVVIEDAAQGVMSSYKGRALGSIGHLGTYSFHETKNVISGEGGSLLINKPQWVEPAEIIREKGTDRSQFFRGQVDKYTWQAVGSSFLPGELIAAFLWAQLEKAEDITEKRLAIWNRYHESFVEAENKGYLRRPIVPEYCDHNAHMYYILLPEKVSRDKVIFDLKGKGVNLVFHYVPLHSSPVGLKVGRVSGVIENTNSLSQRIVRLPLWVGLTQDQQDYIVDELIVSIRKYL